MSSLAYRFAREFLLSRVIPYSLIIETPNPDINSFIFTSVDKSLSSARAH